MGRRRGPGDSGLLLVGRVVAGCRRGRVCGKGGVGDGGVEREYLEP
jgi:hypothetical protein